MRAAIMAVHGRSACADFVVGDDGVFPFDVVVRFPTAKGNLQGIAEYFQTPLKVAMSGGDGMVIVLR